MPETFRDAVETTPALGFHFLCIDCLCIIQDSESDWLHECALMLQVYAGAAVTIAASQSKSPSDGIFREADRPNYTCTVPICWPSTGESNFLTVDLPAQPRFWSPQSASIGPLSQRGWALQEQILSARVLHICASGTFFECAYCERTDRLPWSTNAAVISESLQFSRTFLRSNDPHHVLTQWYGLVYNYTRRLLTYGGDRLPALSGIARVVAQRLDQSYLAGLWSDDLAVGLLWAAWYPSTPTAIHASRYPGPSWSWTSVNRPITISAYEIQKRHANTWFKGWESVFQLESYDWAPCLGIPHCSVELAGDDPFAEVRSGQLTIVGKIRPVMVRDLERPFALQRLWYMSDRFMNVRYSPDLRDPPTAPDKQKDLYCLLVGFRRDSVNCIDCFLLVIRPVSGHDATFKRVGLMKTEYDSDYDEDLDSFRMAIDWLLAAEDQQIYLV